MSEQPLASSQIFSGLEPVTLDKLRAAAQEINYARGEAMLKQGDKASDLYFIQAGRFKVVVDGERTVAHLDAGEVVGELAFFAGGNRTADVIAMRDSRVLKITRLSYEAIAAEQFELPQLLLKLVAERLAQTTSRTGAIQRKTARVIGLLPVGGSKFPQELTSRIQMAMQSVLGETRTVLVADQTSVGVDGYAEWLAEHERQGGYILVNCRGDEQWQTLASRNVDALLLLAERDADAQVGVLEQQASQLLSEHHRNILVLRPSSKQAITNTDKWLANREVGLHHHTAWDSDTDFLKLARFLTGRANGLVLAGGGALGCAHLGAIAAIQKAEIPIDFIGGASAGAAMAGAIATGKSTTDTLDEMEEMFVAAKALKRLTIPVHSLLDPSEFDHQLRSRYGSLDIADLPTLFFAVSTNLSTSAQHIHRRGPLWHAIRASGSLPTILPPFIDDEGNVLVDGGVLDNLPVSVMNSLKQGPNMAIALDSLDELWHSEARYHQVRSRSKLLRDIVLRRKPKNGFPTLFETTQRAMVVTSRMASKDIDDEDTLVITPPRLEGMQILDWHRGRELAIQSEQFVADFISANPARFNKLKNPG